MRKVKIKDRKGLEPFMRELIREFMGKTVKENAAAKYSISDLRHKYKISTNEVIEKLTRGAKKELQDTEDFDIAMELAFSNIWEDIDYYIDR